ncbi:MAG: ergothioneine biosynthesis protein EgtB [Gammaproteobacteria bacterium]
MNIAPRTQPMSAFDCTQRVLRYQQIRDVTTGLCHSLTPEDMTLQSMPDASPTKWHLAHSSWFFEHFLLAPYLKGYRPFSPQFNYLFNSYYYTVGDMHPRSERGLLSRPGIAEVAHYRAHVDEHMHKLLDARGSEPELAYLTTLGLNHEQQHQELLLMDIKHLFARNPLQPRWRQLPAPVSMSALPLKFIPRPEGLLPIGHAGSDFAFDNETPRHRVFIQAHALANRLTTNNDYLEFIRAGGYSAPTLWLSDGWATLQREGWNRPLYWNEDMTEEFTLGGPRALDANAPVCHVSFYEADAFARWAGARLPTEAEWETLAADRAIEGNFMEQGRFHPLGASAVAEPPYQMYGDVWEWAMSPYTPYPGFKPLAGSLGEYNGKFMANQMVLRGGSCATPREHVRASYRNFFYPQQRWQFSGLRLAQDA